MGGQSLASYSYTTDGYNRLSALDFGNEDRVIYTYNSDGNLKKQVYEDGVQIQYKYNKDTSLAAVTDSATGISTRYYYDFTERLSKITESGTNHSFSKTYSYDSSNRLTKISEVLNGDTRNSVYTYDDDNRITTYKKGNISQTYTYDGFGRNSKKVVKNGDSTLLTTTNTFRTVNGNATGQIATLQNEATSYDVTYIYTYDANGNILSVSDGTYTTSYEYDQSNQLVRENHQREQDSYTYVWVYDTAGNILSRTKYPYSTGELGSPAETVNYTYGNTNWGDQLTGLTIQTFTNDQVSTRSFTYAYDDIGNPLCEEIGDSANEYKRTYSWQHGRQLATLTQNGVTWTNTYNADGLRFKRTDGTNTYQYYYSDGNLISLTYNGTKLYFSHTPEGLPYNVEYQGTQYVYVLNQQGDVIAILNAAGVAVVEYTYDAWGNILDIEGSMASTLGQLNPLRYRGYVYDNETQLYYLQSRYYDPEIGRFINADGQISAPGSAVLGNNMYAYCFNNPVNASDPTGNWGEWLKNIATKVQTAVSNTVKAVKDWAYSAY